jgi:cell division protease FtsH
MDTKWLKNSFIYLLIIVALIALFLSFFPQNGGKQTSQLSLSEVIQLAKQGQVKTITVEGDTLLVDRNDTNVQAQVQTDPNTNLYQIFQSTGVPQDQISKINVVYQKPAQFGNLLGLLVQFLPFVFLAGFLLFMMRQAQGSNNQAMSFGKSRARMFMGNKPGVTFSDVAGVEEAKQELQEIVEFLKYPEKFAALGARIPHGVLLVGPPGTGKTLLARAVAGEAGVPFFSISGSEFVEMFVGVGASRVRDLFEQAKRNAPCIIFVDEIDAVGRQRGAGLGGSHDEREQTLNQILVEMDGFDSNTNVIVVAATNRPDVLDPALLRPGRFDRQVVLDRPDISGRRAILDVHMRGKPVDSGVTVEVLAKQTPGFSGADLANLVNEAAILGARRNKKKIGMPEFEEAIDRVIAGPERKSRIISEKEKMVTAYHEAGHAVAARNLTNVDPLHKVSIIARGMMGGYTRLLPIEDRYLWSKSQFEDFLVFALGGHVAEEIVFGEMTTGSENDIERATHMARRMVTEYGMSKRIGPVAMGHKQELVFLGRDIGEQKNYSEKSAEAIDDEVHHLIGSAYNRAKEILTTNREIVDRLAQTLMREETVEGEELERCFNGVVSPPSLGALPGPTSEPAFTPVVAKTWKGPAAEPTTP